MAHRTDDLARRHPFALLPCILGAAVALSAVQAAAAVTPPKRIADKGTLVFCTDISYPPLEYFDAATNQPLGFDVDFGKALVQQMGVKAEYKNITFDGLIPAIQAGQCDAILSGLYDKPNRREVLDFVDYAYIGNSVMVKSDSPVKVQTLEELSGKSAAFEGGSQLEVDLAAANDNLAKQGKPPIKLVPLPKASEAFQQLITGLVDVYYSATVQEAYYNGQNPGQIKLASPQTTALYVGVATMKTDGELHAAFDAAFKELVKSGEYDKIVKKWNMESMASHP